MSIHRATIEWKKEGDFARKKYLRTHRWRFDGGIEVQAAASPSVVPKPWTVDEAVDPEEAFVAAVSSCHMLTFLFHASNDGYVVESYVDEAEGHLRDGWLAEIVLRPRLEFGGEKRPDAAELQQLHHRAHEECFIARSVKTNIRVE
ncbi:MAG: OsmC family protein [Archangium sp.]|nr:OsmC family protein [Archangium sp.]